jgi:hypothetical protein
MADHRVIVTGWRDWPESRRDWIWLHLNETTSVPNGDRLVIVHGQCPKGGADLWAEQWAHRYGFAVERHPADFAKYGKAAGPKRNSHMVSLGAAACIAFPGPGSTGTWDCVRKAADAGIRIEVLHLAQVELLEAAGVHASLHL